MTVCAMLGGWIHRADRSGPASEDPSAPALSTGRAGHHCVKVPTGSVAQLCLRSNRSLEVASHGDGDKFQFALYKDDSGSSEENGL